VRQIEVLNVRSGDAIVVRLLDPALDALSMPESVIA
jgi:hypothetical protein